MPSRCSFCNARLSRRSDGKMRCPTCEPARAQGHGRRQDDDDENTTKVSSLQVRRLIHPDGRVLDAQGLLAKFDSRGRISAMAADPGPDAPLPPLEAWTDVGPGSPWEGFRVDLSGTYGPGRPQLHVVPDDPPDSPVREKLAEARALLDDLGAVAADQRDESSRAGLAARNLQGARARLHQRARAQHPKDCVCMNCFAAKMAAGPPPPRKR